jgi:hypothetical protein
MYSWGTVRTRPSAFDLRPCPMLHALLLGALLLAQQSEFPRLVERFSEGGGYFDSDNLVSNETSYLHVLGGLDALEVRGGAYIGVGPEQSFSYIAHVRPEVAFLVDIRRDNLLLHLLFKAMFAEARNRLEYLGLLFGRPMPADLELWTDLPLESLLEYIDGTPGDSLLHDRTHGILMQGVMGFGVPLSEEDHATLRRFHDEFVREGLGLRFTSRGRPPRRSHPTMRRLYLEQDLEGRPGSYLATEERFRVVRDLHRQDRIIPVVGDLAGPHAIRAIGDYLHETGQQVSLYYLSNVEFYLFRQGAFGRFVENVRALPAGPTSVMVRSFFGRGVQYPPVEPGHLSTQLLQTFASFVAATGSPEELVYRHLISTGHVDLRQARRPPARPRRRGGRRFASNPA